MPFGDCDDFRGYGLYNTICALCEFSIKGGEDLGFIDAVAALDRIQEECFGGGELAELDAFTQMPLDLIEPSVGEKAKRLPGKEIRVYLNVV